MLGCIAAGMGIAMPLSVLSTFPECRRLTVLPPGKNRAETMLIWRKGASPPNISPLREILSRTANRARSRMSLCLLSNAAGQPLIAMRRGDDVADQLRHAVDV